MAVYINGVRTDRERYTVVLAAEAVAASTRYLLIDRSQVYGSATLPFPHPAAANLILDKLLFNGVLTISAIWDIQIGVVTDIDATDANVLWVAQYEFGTSGGLDLFPDLYPLNLGIRQVAAKAADAAEAGTNATTIIATAGFDTTADLGRFVLMTSGAGNGLRRRITAMADANTATVKTFGATAPASGDTFQVVDDMGTYFASNNTSRNTTNFQTDVTLVTPTGTSTAPAVGDLVVDLVESSGTSTLDFNLLCQYRTE